MIPWIRSWAVISCVGLFAGCGQSIGPSQNSTLSLTGTWSGIVGPGSGGGRALRLTWTAAQSGGSVSGPATLLTSPAVTDITISGILTASLAGSQLTLTFTAPAGGVQGSAACSVSGSGSAVVANSTISGSLDVLFMSCEALGLQPPANDQLSLTKQ
jgi:hypothetical protein